MCLKGIKEGFVTIIADPIKKFFTCNIVPVTLFIGLVVIASGAFFNDKIDATLSKGIGEAIVKIGSAIFGAGFFAAIAKSSQFVSIFKKHISEVFFNPENFMEQKDLIDRWSTITNAILKNALPYTHNKVSGKMKEQFLNSEIDYHFKDYEIKYDIELIENGKNVKILAYSRTNILISPNKKNPILKQDICTTCDGGSVTLLKVVINNEPIRIDDFVHGDNSSKTLNLPLANYRQKNSGGDQLVKFERYVEMVQVLRDEPDITSTISKYIEGAIVDVKVKSDTHKIVLREHGILNVKKIEDEYRWILAGNNELLLPGQGYTILILPK